MFDKPGWYELLIFNNFKNFIDFILNLNWLRHKKFFEIVFIGNNDPYFFQIDELCAKVTQKLHRYKFFLFVSEKFSIS
jgi:hypothetical protein